MWTAGLVLFAQLRKYPLILQTPPARRACCTMPDAQLPMPCLDLFSGCGGMALALQHVCRTVAYCEIDERCGSLLRDKMAKGQLDKAPVFTDVSKLRGSDLERGISPVIICGGFPCQDISSVNPNAVGITGERSGLVSHVFRLIKEIPSVRCVLLENSSRIRTLGLDVIHKRFRAMGWGYVWGIFTVNDDVGGLIGRKRWVCLAVAPGFRIPTSPSVRKAQAAYIRTYSVRWRRPEPVPRVILRGTIAPGVLWVRQKQMGNAVVPPCITFAFVTLCDTWNSSLDGMAGQPCTKLSALTLSSSLTLVAAGKSSKQPCSFPRTPWLRPPPSPVAVKLVLQTVGDKSAPTFIKTSWASPRANMWHGYRMLDTDRKSHMLAVQVLHEARTLPTMRALGKWKSERDEEISDFRINPQFVEWLMGYPLGWTKQPGQLGNQSDKE